tara:strand:- start:421 stop:681 length:261 start_codon:yes stop_codon:yes gene_type:complete
MYFYNDLKGRKGVLEEVISKALYSDEPGNYSVSYREFDHARDAKLLEFLELSDNFETIPASRIILVKRKGKIIYRTSRPELYKLLK